MNEYLVPAGTYYLGDPCYCFNDHTLWHSLLHSNDYFRDCSKPFKGYNIFGFSTAYGDGTYRGSNGFSYSVDAGLIGLVPLEAAQASFQPDLQTIITFKEPTMIYSSGTVLVFGDVTIDTGFADGEEEDYFDHEYDDVLTEDDINN